MSDRLGSLKNVRDEGADAVEPRAWDIRVGLALWGGAGTEYVSADHGAFRQRIGGMNAALAIRRLACVGDLSFGRNGTSWRSLGIDMTANYGSHGAARRAAISHHES
jgi:hypothetical protein